MLSQVKPTCTTGYNGKITKKVGLWEIEKKKKKQNKKNKIKKTKAVWHQGTSVPHSLFSLSLSPLKSPTCLEKTHSGFKAERGEPPFFSVSVSVSLSLSLFLFLSADPESHLAFRYLSLSQSERF